MNGLQKVGKKEGNEGGKGNSVERGIQAKNPQEQRGRISLSK